MNKASISFSLLKWLFCRLPLAFSLPFIFLSLCWVFYGFKFLKDSLAMPLFESVSKFLNSELPDCISRSLINNLDAFILAVIVIILFLVGFLVAYNFSAFLNWIVVKLKLKPIRYTNGSTQLPLSNVEAKSPFDKVTKIGIVLAGGGAKGAFQAGAMKAIYQYLYEHNALKKVKVISSTSIGSWNALFWLANFIKPTKEWHERSVHEWWWRKISAKSLTAPSWYVPFFRNAFLSSEPWQQVFDHIFGQADVKKQIFNTDIHFYLTRSNVRSGELEYVTNNPAPTSIARVKPEIINPSAGQNEFLDKVKAGVFASMDLPPLFPYFKQDDNYFEDGGVIDNLPITFPAMEGCDLIFILSLNSDYEEEPNKTSVIARLFRVMDVRQGVLERNGFKMLYLYNESAALRNFANKFRASLKEEDISASTPLNTALQRQNEHINVFAVCPHKSFVQTTINTQELWKRKEAGIAFDVMYQSTLDIIANFNFSRQQDIVRVALISRGGNVFWDERF